MIRFTYSVCNDSIVAFNVSGHAGYDESGFDIVCAAVSMITQNTVNGLEAIVGIKNLIYFVDDEGELDCKLPDSLDDETMANAQILLKTLLLGMEDLVTNYEDYILIQKEVETCD